MSKSGNQWRWRYLKYTVRRLRRISNPPEASCNICGFSGIFDPYGWPARPHARCPQCLSLERHREFKLWLDRGGAARIKGARLLHFAPERATREILEPIAGTYLGADLNPTGADLAINIEHIDLPEASVDVVICFHVLEHVDDRKALAELHRIIAPGGLAVIMVPVIEGWERSYEDASITQPEDRVRHFGQHDHLRRFGADIRARIAEAGFQLDEVTAVEPEAMRHGLQLGSKIFLSDKAHGTAAAIPSWQQR